MAHTQRTQDSCKRSQSSQCSVSSAALTFNCMPSSTPAGMLSSTERGLLSFGVCHCTVLVQPRTASRNEISTST